MNKSNISFVDIPEQSFNLNDLLIKRPAATFLIRAAGDILIVDRSLPPSNGKIVIAVINSEFTVKRFFKKGKKILLQADNCPDITIQEESDCQIWGVVTYVICPR